MIVARNHRDAADLRVHVQVELNEDIRSYRRNQGLYFNGPGRGRQGDVDRRLPVDVGDGGGRTQLDAGSTKDDAPGDRHAAENVARNVRDAHSERRRQRNTGLAGLLIATCDGDQPGCASGNRKRDRREILELPNNGVDLSDTDFRPDSQIAADQTAGIGNRIVGAIRADANDRGKLATSGRPWRDHPGGIFVYAIRIGVGKAGADVLNSLSLERTGGVGDSRYVGALDHGAGRCRNETSFGELRNGVSGFIEKILAHRRIGRRRSIRQCDGRGREDELDSVAERVRSGNGRGNRRRTGLAHTEQALQQDLRAAADVSDARIGLVSAGELCGVDAPGNLNACQWFAAGIERLHL